MKNNSGFALDPYTDDPTKKKSPQISPAQLPVKIQAVDLLPPRNSADLKRILMRTGAVYTSIYVGETDRDMELIYNESKAAFWNPLETGAGHAVAIVGWDADYPRSRFKPVGGIEQLAVLEQLDLEGSGIRDLTPLRGLRALKGLSLAGLDLGETKNLETLSGLEILDLSGTRYTSLDGLQGMVNLKVLSLANTSLKNLDALKPLKRLERLDLRNNLLSDVSSLASFTNLTELLLRGNSLRDLSPLKSLSGRLRQKDFSPERVEVVKFADSRLEKAVRETLHLTADEPLTPLVLEDVDVLDLSSADEKSPLNLAGIEALTELTDLSLPGFHLKDVSVLGKLINLESLDLASNQISDLTFLKSLVNLTYLDLDLNKISDLRPLSALVDLEEIYLNGNQIADASILSTMKKLAVLDISSNKIEQVAVLTGLRGLNSLFVRGNPATDVKALAPMLDRLDDYDFGADGVTFDPETHDYEIEEDEEDNEEEDDEEDTETDLDS